MWKPFIHVDDQTVNKAFGGNEYQIGADNQTIFQALEALGVGAFQIWRVSILGDSCLPGNVTAIPSHRHRLPEWNRGCRIPGPGALRSSGPGDAAATC